MTGFAIGYDPNNRGECPCGEQAEIVHVTIDGTAVCTFCAGRRLPAFADVADALDDLDRALFQADEGARPTLVSNAFAILSAITSARVPDSFSGDPLIDDETFAMEVLRRITGQGLDYQGLLGVLAALVPDVQMTKAAEIIAQLREQWAAAAARHHANADRFAAFAILMRREPDGALVNDVVERLRLDLPRFLDSTLTAAAVSGTPVMDLPDAVVDDLIRNSTKDGAQ
ncbi:hypothetical protein ABGB07_03755 [Micromonosporaceae bacterium B7E4]